MAKERVCPMCDGEMSLARCADRSDLFKWIAPGTIIVSDCWKADCNLEKHGYVHRTVNHSKEFVNENGDNTKKIEGHWRQAKRQAKRVRN